MKTYFLDTHILLWVFLSSEKLSAPLRGLLSYRKFEFFYFPIRARFAEYSRRGMYEKKENTVAVSALSFWEISLKHALGKLELSGITPEGFPRLCASMGFLLLPLTPEESASFFRLPKEKHKDPFDRMLVWQAIQKNMIFITHDRRMSIYEKYGLDWIS